MSTARPTRGTRPALLLAALIAAVVPVAAAAPAADAAESAEILRLERIAFERLGRDAVGCATAEDENSPVRLKVTDRAAVQEARRIAAAARFRVTVHLIPRRRGLPAMTKVYRQLGRAAEGRRLVAIGRDHEGTRLNNCGPAKISFGEEHAAWAAAQQRRFGSDRVTLRLVEPGDRMPLGTAPWERGLTTLRSATSRSR